MKKSLAVMLFALVALSFIQFSIVVAEDGSASTSSSESASAGANAEVKMSGSEQKVRIAAEMKARQDTKAEARAEMKEQIRNDTKEMREELRNEIKGTIQDEKERRIAEFKLRMQTNGGAMEIQNRRIVISELTDDQKEIIAGKINARTGLNLTSEDIDGNGTALRAILSNGAFAEIRILPDVAARRALDKMKANCEERNCSVELKEVAEGRNKSRAVYEIRSEKEARTFLIFKTRMKIDAEVDPQTGEVLKVHKPWWAFLANEKDETSTVAVEAEDKVDANLDNITSGEINLANEESVNVTLN